MKIGSNLYRGQPKPAGWPERRLFRPPEIVDDETVIADVDRFHEEA